MEILSDTPGLTKEVTIVIKEEQLGPAVRFTVPENLVTKRSEYFRATCSNKWKVASTRVVKLSDVDYDAFSAYMSWMHREQVTISYQCANGKDSDDHYAEHICAVLTSLVKLWLLADRLVDVKLQNAVVNEIIKTINRVMDDSPADSTLLSIISPSLTNLIWSATTFKRSLRRSFIQYYVSCVPAQDIESRLNVFRPEFIKDLMLTALYELERHDPECSWILQHPELPRDCGLYHEPER